jgi:glycosyltransferase involved in cell wall biosynthesis
MTPSDERARRPVQVLHVFGRMHRGGAEMRTLELHRALNPSRVAFAVATLGRQPGNLEDVARRQGMTIHPCPLGLGVGRRFTRLLEALKVDVVHSDVHHASGYFLAKAARCGVPHRIAHFHSSSDGRGHNPRRWLQRKVMRRLIDRYATAIVACSETAMRGSWGEHWQKDPRCRIAYYSLETAGFNMPCPRPGVRHEFEIPPEAPLFIHVGTFHAVKNQIRLVEMFQAILSHVAGAHLLLVGRDEDGYVDAVRKHSEALGIADRVRFAGERRDVPRLLRAADVMVFPSLWEGLPGAILEAKAAGLHILASDVGGVLEMQRVFPDIEAMPLQAPDAEWAERAVRLLSRPRTDPVDFDRTPFSPHVAAQFWQSMYGVA